MGLGDKKVTKPLKTADCEYVNLLSTSVLLSLQASVLSSSLCMDKANAPLAIGQDKFSANLTISMSS